MQAKPHYWDNRGLHATVEQYIQMFGSKQDMSGAPRFRNQDSNLVIAVCLISSTFVLSKQIICRLVASFILRLFGCSALLCSCTY